MLSNSLAETPAGRVYWTCWDTVGTQSGYQGRPGHLRALGSPVVTVQSLWDRQAALRPPSPVVPCPSSGAVSLHGCRIFLGFCFSLHSRFLLAWLSWSGGVHKGGTKAKRWVAVFFFDKNKDICSGHIKSEQTYWD